MLNKDAPEVLAEDREEPSKGTSRIFFSRITPKRNPGAILSWAIPAANRVYVTLACFRYYFPLLNKNIPFYSSSCTQVIPNYPLPDVSSTPTIGHQESTAQQLKRPALAIVPPPQNPTISTTTADDPVLTKL